LSAIIFVAAASGSSSAGSLGVLPA